MSKKPVPFSNLTAAQIRQGFLDFFRAQGHTIVPSASLIPGDDPTLIFTNSGMNQFKDVFLGVGKRPYTRVADTQKCMRVSGKHNDLEDVGRDHYHHTLFEMLGNWSFGDYYKKESIAWGWKLLTEVWGIPKDRLHVTVHHSDDEAAEIWKEHVVSPAYITRHGDKDNFWEMGETGPCGPCTEIHFDLGAELQSVPDSGPNKDDARFREIWNHVFIQYERHPDRSLTPLPAKHVDTGMGFERIVAILQGQSSNYATDLFSHFIEWVAKESGVAYAPDVTGMAHRVIADHLRATAFTIADGVVPSNEGRGYVVRRILRRAARYGKKLGLEKPFLCRMVPLLVDVMGDAFPELRSRRDHVAEILRSEEERFATSLEKGLKVFGEEAGRLEAAGHKRIPGPVVFALYDTHGFPSDLTRLLAQERGMTIDEAGFESLHEAAKERTREASAKFKQDDDGRKAAEGLPATAFTGYLELSTRATVQRVQALAGTAEVLLVLDRTPCYAESGGQVADKARVSWARPSGRGQPEERGSATLVHCSKVGEVIVHRIAPEPPGLLPRAGDTVEVEVDAEARARTACNHTATHLLHAALKKVLGDHVQQAGSLVAPDRLRFDFVHSRALSAEDIAKVEELVNRQIVIDRSLRVEEMDRGAADARGAVALFGEKYGEKVRVVEVPGFSTELCGGTHVDRTGRILWFKVLSQGSVAANVRRVDCLAGPGLLDLLLEKSSLLDALAGELGCKAAEVPGRVEALAGEVRKLKKDLTAAKKAGGGPSMDPAELARTAWEVPGKGFRLASGATEGLGLDALRDLSDAVLAKLGKGVVLLAGSHEGKAQFVCKVAKDLVDAGAVHAGKLVSRVAQVAGGKGGGRPDMATAGAPDPSRIPAALDEARVALGS